jgi:hypothetical protein
VVALRSEYQIDCRRAADDLFALGLRYTTGYRDEHTAIFGRGGFFEAAHAAKFGVNLFSGFLADMAGIQDDEIGILGCGSLDVTVRRQGVRHPTRVVDVHLTTKRFDVKLTGLAHKLTANPSLCDRSRNKLQDRNRILHPGTMASIVAAVRLPGFCPK